MSRLGKTPILLPQTVKVVLTQENEFEVQGPKGVLHLQFPIGLSLLMENQSLLLQCDEKLVSSAVHGLYRSLLRNAVIGVSEGFEQQLTLVGVGYKASVIGNKLDLQLGFSHPTALDIPAFLQVSVDKGVLIVIKGIDNRQVGQFAASVRAMKRPEPFKGKGIRYKDEVVRKKEGKSAKSK